VDTTNKANRSDGVTRRLDLRSDAAGRSFSRCCLSWLDASREIFFGSATIMVRTMADVSDYYCDPWSERKASRGGSVGGGERRIRR